MWFVTFVTICIINTQIGNGAGTGGTIQSNSDTECRNLIHPPGQNEHPAPLDLVTERVILRKTSNLTFIYRNTKLNLKNDGSTIRITPVSSPYSTNNITMGILGNCTYYLVEFRIFWNPSKLGGCSYIIDATTFTISVQAVFCKNRLNLASKDNECVIFAVPTEVEGTYPNPKFVNFGNALKKVQKAGSSTQIMLTDINSWIYQIDVATFYYAYNGSVYIFNKNNTQIYPAVFISLPKFVTGWISNCQFVYFQNLRNYYNTPLAPLQPSYRYTDYSTQIFQSVGFTGIKVD